MSVAPVAEPPDRAEYPYKMKDLCDRTGLPRQVIHFYIQQGLLPEGHKTGRNMAYYGDKHLERLKLIKQLQNERFLPLKAIRAVLEGREDAFTPAQQQLLVDVKQRLAPVLGDGAQDGGPAFVDLNELLLRTGASRDDAREMEDAGMFTSTRRKGKTVIPKDQAWLVELWGEMRRVGFSRALGFSPKDMHVFADALNDMFQREMDMLKGRLGNLPPEQVAPMVEQAIPIINTFLTRYHESLIRSFFASVQG